MASLPPNIFEGKRYQIYVHSAIFSMFNDLNPGNSVVDHEDRCRLNNTPSNLFLKSQRENRINSDSCDGRLIGVSYFQPTNKFRAQILVANKRLTIGYFDSPEEAARAYDAAAIQHFGIGASNNESLGRYSIL
jgi:hypothetical protein